MKSGEIYQKWRNACIGGGGWNCTTPNFSIHDAVLMTEVSFGKDFGLYLDREGCIYSMGDNSRGQLGVSYGAALTNEYVKKPMLISSFVDSAGGIINKEGYSDLYWDDHNMILSEHGGVCAWGNNCKGQCGVGKKWEIIRKPQIIEELMGIVMVKIRARGSNSYARADKDGHWIWGDNSYGQCTMEMRLWARQNDIQCVPYRIDQVFVERTGKRIDRVYLEYESVYVVPFV